MKTKSLITTFFAAAIFPALLQAEPMTLEIDPSHSGVNFDVRHFFSKVPGRFNKFSGTIVYDPEQVKNSSVEVTIPVKSIDTADEKRDDHLRSEDFFHVEKYPEITFKSKKVESTGEGTAKITGDLTIHGVTKEVVLDAKKLGEFTGMEGEKRYAFEAETKINRDDFGITWNRVVEGTAVVGKEVDIYLQVEAFKKENGGA